MLNSYLEAEPASYITTILQEKYMFRTKTTENLTNMQGINAEQ